MTDIDDRIAARLREAAADGGRSVQQAALQRVVELGRGRARRHRVGRGLAGSVVLAAVVVLVFTIPLPHVLLHGGSSPSTTVPGAEPTPLPTVPVVQFEAGSWGTLPAAPIPPRTNAAEVWTGRELLVWGGGSGTEDADLHDDGAAYDPATNTWRKLPPSPLSPRGGTSAVWTGSEMVIYGGYLSAVARPWHVADDAAAYDPSSNTWTTLASPPLGPRANALGVWTGSEVVLLGGDPASGPAVSDGAALDPATGAWTYIASAVPSPAALQSNFAGALLWGDEVLAVAVTTSLSSRDSLVDHLDVYAYDLPTGRWSTLRSTTVTDQPLTAWTGRYLLLQSFQLGEPSVHCGACSVVGVSARYELWDPVTGATIATLPPLGLADVDFAWTGNAVVAFDASCGCGSNGRGSAYLYDPALRSWTELEPAPFGCLLGEQAVWTGRLLLLYCPQGAGGPSGLAFSPTVPTTTPSCFNAGFNHDVTTLTVSDAQPDHGRWPVVSLNQLVVLDPAPALFSSFDAGPTASVFADGKVVGYLPVPAPSAGPSPDPHRAIVQFTSPYVPGRQYLVEVPFTGKWSSLLRGSRRTTFELCATVVIAGQTGPPPPTTVVGS